jgi:hypothetical protein
VANRNNAGVGESAKSTQHSPWLKPFAIKREHVAFVFLAIGLSSFFMPLITVDPAVMNQTRWSPFDTFCGLYTGNLQFEFVPGQPRYLFPLAPFELAWVYIAMFLALFAVSRPSRQFLLAVTFFVTSGFIAVGFSTGGGKVLGPLPMVEGPLLNNSFSYDLECVFYKGASQQVPGYFGHVNCSQLLTVLLAASLALMLSGWFNYQDENAVEEEVGGRSGDRSEQ